MEYLKKNFIVIALGLIFLLGLFLRLFSLDKFPVGFQVDEASKGYSAYSLLKTGKDDNNNKLPLYIDVFGDFSPAGYHYTVVPSVAVFGLNEFAVRFPGALAGSLTILATYLFIYSIFLNRKLSLLSSLFLAISPWHINMSRASSESLISLFLIVLGFGFVIYSLRKNSTGELFLGTISLFLSFLFYQTPRFFVPLFFLTLILFLIFVVKEKIVKNYKKALIISFVVLCLLDFLLIFVVKGGTGRFSQVSIFSSPETNLVLAEQIREDGVAGTNTLETRFFHNKIVNNAETYVLNYLSYYSWTFLFVRGLPSIYDVPNTGVLYFFFLPFFILGVIFLSFNKDKFKRIPILLLLIAPTSAALAADVSNMQRALIMFFAIEIISVFGLYYFINLFIKRKRIIASTLIAILFILNFSYFLHQYFIHAKYHRTWYRNNGFSDMMKVVNANYSNYDKIVVTKSTGGTYPLVQFYSKFDPANYQRDGSPKDKNYKGFGKFFFVPEECPSLLKIKKDYPKTGKILYVNNGTCKDDLKHEQALIKREDGTDGFKIVYWDKAI